MNNTTYDNIYSAFYTGNKIDASHLPLTVEEQMDLVKYAVTTFNLKLDRDVACDDDLEEINCTLNPLELRLVVECMKLKVFEEMSSEFISNWSVFNNDIGRNQFQSQWLGMESKVKRQDEKIIELVNKLKTGENGGDA